MKAKTSLESISLTSPSALALPWLAVDNWASYAGKFLRRLATPRDTRANHLENKGPKLWSELHDNTKHAISINSFKFKIRQQYTNNYI